MGSLQTFAVKKSTSYLSAFGRYNRFVTNVTDESEINILLFDIFQLRMERYLVGVGHPLPLKGTAVSQEDFAKDFGDCVLRCCLILLAITDSDLLPLNTQTKLEVTYSPPTEFIGLISIHSQSVFARADLLT
jgi:hypothetical protein